MILSDRTIKEYLTRKEIIIDPYPEKIQPSSIDLHLSPTILIWNTVNEQIIDPMVNLENAMLPVDLDKRGYFNLLPANFILGSTIERVTIPHNLVARLEGKSSLGRMGLIIHATAGYVDPGFEGNLTLEISNLSPLPIKLYPGMRICQISFAEMTTPADNPYGSQVLESRYQGQSGPIASRYNRG